MSVITLLLVYFTVINLFAFLLMYTDKLKARKRAFRIPESTLFTTALIGGSPGCLLGMYTFRHKTRHRSFVLGIPLILIIQLIILAAVIFSPLEVNFL